MAVTPSTPIFAKAVLTASSFWGLTTASIIFMSRLLAEMNRHSSKPRRFRKVWAAPATADVNAARGRTATSACCGPRQPDLRGSGDSGRSDLLAVFDRRRAGFRERRAEHVLQVVSRFTVLCDV